MKQDSALRRVEVALECAIHHNDSEASARAVISFVMGLDDSNLSLIRFYGLLDKARDEAQSLQNFKRKSRYIRRLSNLYGMLLKYDLGEIPWGTVAEEIDSTGVLESLDSLANYFSIQNPSVSLEPDFLEQLSNEISDVLTQVQGAGLSRKARLLLVRQLEGILRAIQRYGIDGSKGLKKSVQAVITDLVITEHEIGEKDKRSPSYKRVVGWAGALLLYLVPPPNAWDLVGAVPDFNEFWAPQIGELLAGQKEIEDIFDDALTVQELFAKTANLVRRNTQIRLGGAAEYNSLPPVKREQTDNLFSKHESEVEATGSE